MAEKETGASQPTTFEDNLYRVSSYEYLNGIAVKHNRSFTPNGKYLVSELQGLLSVIETSNWNVLHLMRKSGNKFRKKSMWYINSGQISNRFVLANIGSPTRSGVREFEVWDLETGKLWSEFELKAGSINECQFTDDGSRLFLLSGSVVHIIDLPRGREVLRIPPESKQPFTPEPNSQTYFTLNANGNDLNLYTVFMDSGKVVKKVYDGRPLTEEELRRASRIRDLQTQQLPPVPKEIPHPSNISPVTASDYLDLANRARKGNDLKKAVLAYQEAIKRDPDYYFLHRSLAQVLISLGDVESALRERRKTIRLEPRDYGSHFAIGMILSDRRDFKGAVPFLQEAIRKDPRRREAGVNDPSPVSGYLPRSWMNNALGNALKELGQLEEAEKEIRKAIGFLQSERFDTRPYTNLGSCLIRQGKLKEAETEMKSFVKTMEEMIRKHPQDKMRLSEQLAQATLDIGAMYLAEAKQEEAVIWSKEATKLFTEIYKNKKVPDTQKQLRWTHWHEAVALAYLNRPSEAIPVLDLAIKYTPDAEKPTSFMMRARFVAKTGAHKEANKKVRELLARKPAGNNTWFYWEAALAYSLCSTAVKEDQKQQKTYQNKAIEMLRRSMAEGFNQLPFIRFDVDLNPIRDLAEFKEIVAELERRLSQTK